MTAVFFKSPFGVKRGSSGVFHASDGMQVIAILGDVERAKTHVLLSSDT